MDNNCKIYKRRWMMLMIFCLASGLNSVHWIQYAIITNIVTYYYSVSVMVVNWSAMIFSAVYIPLVFPATWFIEKKGLRLSLISGLIMMCCGSWFKLLSVDRGLFYVGFACQFILGSAQTFLLSVPARLAALWFPSNEVATVCAVGVLGNQLGTAASFFLPPVFVRNSPNPDDVKNGFFYLHLAIAIPTTLLLIVTLFVFEDAPRLPPNMVQYSAREENAVTSYTTTLSRLFSNKDYILLLSAYGLNVGVYYAYSTLLNQMFLLHFPDGEEDAGRIGMSLIFGGMVGTVVMGFFLDKTHYFKGTTIGSYLLSLTGMMGFTFSLNAENVYLVYASSTFMGIFMTGYLAVGYDYGVELTYPLPESTSSGVMNSIGEGVGLSLAIAAGLILDRYGDLATNLVLLTVLCSGFVVSLFLSDNHLRRSAAARMSDDVSLK